MMGLLITAMLAALAAVIILAVMFGPDERHDANVRVAGRPLAIEAPPCNRPRVTEVEHVGTWDEVDQAWGDAQWMMAVGG